MIIKSADFLTSAVKSEGYPTGNRPEIAFIGRSNVGKSSLLNTLACKKNLARIGSLPGKTRLINFFLLNDRFLFVDLPGYGYANVSKTEKATWRNIIETYLHSREQLKLVVMLVDIRHEPNDDDKMIYNWIVDNEMNHLIIASKADKIAKNLIKGRLQNIIKELGTIGGTVIIPFSVLKNWGREEVLREFEKTLQL